MDESTWHSDAELTITFDSNNNKNAIVLKFSFIGLRVSRKDKQYILHTLYNEAMC